MMPAQQNMIEMVARAASQAAEAATAIAAMSIAQAQQTTAGGPQNQRPTLGADDTIVLAQAVAAQVATTMATAAPIKIKISENERFNILNEQEDDNVMGEDKRIEELKRNPEGIGRELDKVMLKYSSRIIQYIGMRIRSAEQTRTLRYSTVMV
jgi:hypothetical protein